MPKFQLSRFEQHHELPQVGLEGQEKFHNAKILVVGAGGLGCPALLYLVAAGIGKIGIVDEDKVSLSNLQRQILYGNDDVDQLKVNKAKERLSTLAYNQDIRTYPHFLNEQNALEIVRDYDVVIDATDNHQSRLLLNSICRQLNKPWIYGALYHMECQLMTFHNDSDQEPCFQCLYSFLNKDSTLPTCKSAGVLSTIPGILGTMQANEALKVVLNTPPVKSHELILMNFETNNHFKIDVSQNPECKVCAHTHSVNA